MFLHHGHGFFLAGLFLMSATATACADEGMWVFNNLPLGTLKARYGFEPPRGMGRPSAVVGGAVQQWRVGVVRLG